MSPNNPQPTVPDQSDPFAEPRCVPGAWDYSALQAADDARRAASPAAFRAAGHAPAQAGKEAAEWREALFVAPPITVWANSYDAP